MPTNTAGVLGITFLMLGRTRLNLEIQNFTLFERSYFNSASQMQQDSLEDSYCHKKDSEIDILTTLSDSTPKDRHVDIIRHGGKVKENLENKSSPRKCELSTELFVLVVWKKEVSDTETIV